ncbi:unnamed protein product, partial [Adineta steineri]
MLHCDLKVGIWRNKNFNSEPNILLIYVYAESHSYALGNLIYFIETAVEENDQVDYYFIMQQTNNTNINERTDGISLDPYEIAFIKFNYKRLNDGIIPDRALVYEKWGKDLKNNTA